MASVALAVSKMTAGMFVTVVDGCEPQKIALSIAKSETNDISNLIFGPVMEGLEIGQDLLIHPAWPATTTLFICFIPVATH